MAGRLTITRREELAAEAYELSIQGHSCRAIGRQLGVSHPTASSLIHEETKRRSPMR